MKYFKVIITTLRIIYFTGTTYFHVPDHKPVSTVGGEILDDGEKTYPVKTAIVTLLLFLLFHFLINKFSKKRFF